MFRIISLIVFTISNFAYAHNIRTYPGAPMDIITIGHPTLYLQAQEVDHQEITDTKFQELIDNMIVTMKKAKGVGLAAPQVNISKRMFVMKPGFFKKAEAIINPTVEYLPEAGTKNSTEGCLSIPGKSFKVQRYNQLHLSYFDRQGRQQQEKARGFRAIVIQHEYDHLNGTLISDIFLKAFDLSDDFEFSYPMM